MSTADHWKDLVVVILLTIDCVLMQNIGVSKDLFVEVSGETDSNCIFHLKLPESLYRMIDRTDHMIDIEIRYHVSYYDDRSIGDRIAEIIQHALIQDKCLILGKLKQQSEVDIRNDAAIQVSGDE